MCAPTIEITGRTARDMHLEDQAHAELQASSYVDLRQITCCVHGRCLELHGRVASFFLKQIAQSTLLSRFRNELKIVNGLTVGSRPFSNKSTDGQESSTL